MIPLNGGGPAFPENAAIDGNHAVVFDFVIVDALVIVAQALVACPRFHAAVLFENLLDLRGIIVFAAGILRKPTMEGTATAAKTATISTRDVYKRQL